MQAVRLLLDSGVDIDAKNFEDHTAGEILVKRQEEYSSSSSREISEMLQRAEVTKCARCLRSIVLSLEEKWAKISDDRRNVLLVVATLLMTVTYQGLLSPPGGLWQDDYNPGSNLPNATIPEYRRFNETTFVENVAGTAIGARVYFFWLFLTTNTLTFILSYTTVLLVIPSGYVILHTALGSLSVCYIALMAVILPIDFLYTRAITFVILFLLCTHYLYLHVSVLIRSSKKN